MKKIKLKINSQTDRRDLIAILADSGYVVTIEAEEDTVFNKTYYVIIQLK